VQAQVSHHPARDANGRVSGDRYWESADCVYRPELQRERQADAILKVEKAGKGKEGKTTERAKNGVFRTCGEGAILFSGSLVYII